MKKRCSWCGKDPLYIHYHDTEWGVPVHDDRKLFEMLVLEGAQAGLSWITILKKREQYRQAFDLFDVHAIANFSERDIDRLLANPGIVRNRLKIVSAVKNAGAVLNIRKEFGSLDNYFWSYVDGRPLQNNRQTSSEIPAKTALSTTLSKDMKKRGFSFVGPTICYAFMQSVGMVNDHLVECYRYREIEAMV